MRETLGLRLFFISATVLWLVPTLVMNAAPRDVLSSAWEIDVQENLAAREYWIAWQDRTQPGNVPAAWHAPNRAQGFRTYFTPEGIRVIPRTGDSPDWEWSLSLSGYGRGGIARPVARGRLFPHENRIEFDRQEVLEWFVNEPQGLKHGFVLHAPPDGGRETIDRGGEVHLDLQVGGSLTPVLGSASHSVRFAASSGLAVLYYDGLEVRDAQGRDLPARMETHVTSGGRVIRLVVDDRGAAYPLEIDPLATTAAWIAEGDQVDAAFGLSVATAGDVNGDGFADVIVGAYKYDNGESNEGQVYVYHGSATGLSTTADWTTESNQAQANYHYEPFLHDISQSAKSESACYTD